MSKKRRYSVTLVLAGHVEVEVDADSEEDAIDKAHNENWEWSDIRAMEQPGAFNKGNVCFCPEPWEDTVEDIGPAENDED